MALHTNVGLGDFILMEKIDMEQFIKNLKIRWAVKVIYMSHTERRLKKN